MSSFYNHSNEECGKREGLQMWLKWLPWRWVLSRVARSRGFIDPVVLLSQLHNFAAPSEVQEPIELLRAGTVLHARGLINTKAIQHNKDWVWPFWVEKQFNPADNSFIPRAFSLTHINLTHRNWTGIGLPGFYQMPIIDPRGLITPYFDSWSLDFWIISDQSELIPSRDHTTRQWVELKESISVVTKSFNENHKLWSSIEVVNGSNTPSCVAWIKAESDIPALLVISIRPYNPEGISFIHDIEIEKNNLSAKINGSDLIHLSKPCHNYRLSNYHSGDVYSQILNPINNNTSISCTVGLASAALIFPLEPGNHNELTVEIPLTKNHETNPSKTSLHSTWQETLTGKCELISGGHLFEKLFRTSSYSVVLLSPDEIYPGPYTYKRFWFRDAGLMIHALVKCGYFKIAQRALEYFPSRQKRNGFYHSQQGEWDSNGITLWIINLVEEISGNKFGDKIEKSLIKGCEWICDKLTSENPNSLHSGLLPAGFSAEHFGPNDFYYWDDFWSVAGLRSAADFLERRKNSTQVNILRSKANKLLKNILHSIKRTQQEKKTSGIPASPYRRMDAGAIGSISASYPTQIFEPQDENVLQTIEYLIQNCFHQGVFFQDIIHSGLNPYLSLHIAQVLLRSGNPLFFSIMQRVAELASPTGQWPEAVHPITGGGCMGDGHHGWASAEWLLIVRSCFLREEGEKLIFCSGIVADWFSHSNILEFGPSFTKWGSIKIKIENKADSYKVNWDALWKESPQNLTIHFPGTNEITVKTTDSEAFVNKLASS